MAKMTSVDIARLAISTGVPSNQVATAVAIALAESGGNTTAHNTRGLDNSYGLWQINMYGDLGPSRRKVLGLGSNEELFTPSVNARAMMHISNGGKNWTPWTTFTRGTYLVQLPDAMRATYEATGQRNSGLDLPNGLGPMDTFRNISKGFTVLTDKNTWIRVGLFVGGFVLVVIALMKLTGDNQLSPMTKDAAKLILFRKVSK